MIKRMKRLTEKILLEEPDMEGELLGTSVANVPAFAEPNVTLDVEADEKAKEENTARVDSGVTSLLTSAIVSKFSSVDMFNSVLATLESMIQENVQQESIDGYNNIRAILTDIISEENIHIGQLQKALTLVSGSASFIEDGKVEAEEIIDGVERALGDE